MAVLSWLVSRMLIGGTVCRHFEFRPRPIHAESKAINVRAAYKGHKASLNGRHISSRTS